MFAAYKQVLLARDKHKSLLISLAMVVIGALGSTIVFAFYPQLLPFKLQRHIPPKPPKPILAPLSTVPAEFYVSPAGTPQSDGSYECPWDIATALAHPRTIAPGSTIWLGGGTYRGVFTSKLKGTDGVPIVVRATPGERVVIDSGGERGDPLTVRGAWTTYWGFELMNSDTRRVVDTRGSYAVKAWRGDGVTVLAPHTKLINLIIHDNSNGIGSWMAAEGAEIYGCLIFNNGWLGPDRGHGHGIYVQNKIGTKRIVDSILFNNFGRGIQVYGTNASTVGFHIEGNAAFNNYSPSGRGTAKRHPNLFVGTVKLPADDIEIVGNYLYHPPDTYSEGGANMALGYNRTVNKSIVVRDNYIAGGSRALSLALWDEVTMTGNTFHAGRAGAIRSEKDIELSMFNRLADVRVVNNVALSKYNWNGNRYYDDTRVSRFVPPTAFFFGKQPRRDYASWKEVTGFDEASQYASGRPDGMHVVVRPNAYERGRAHIVVYNWNASEFVEADVEAILPVNAKYEVRDVQNYFGAPIMSGIYKGGTLRVPLTKGEVAPPVGYDFTPASTAPEFNVFVLSSTLPESKPKPATKIRDADKKREPRKRRHTFGNH